MIAIDWKQSWPLVEAAVRSHNQRHVVGTKQDGKPKYDLRKVLRTPHQHLLKELVRMYSRQLAGYRWLHLTTNLPPFHTNCVTLGKAMGLCKATIHNQLERLLESGLLLEKDHRGRHNDFTIRFLPSILSLHPELEERRRLDIPGDIPLLLGGQHNGTGIAKTLGQVPDASPFKKENKLPVGKVENEPEDAKTRPDWIGGLEARVLKAGNPPFQGGPGAARPPKNSFQDSEYRQEETPFQGSGKRGAVAERPAPAPVPPQFEDYCIRLLSVIVGSLYRGIDFMAKSQLEAITGFLSRQFECKSEVEGEAVYRDLWMRIGLAERWVARKPGRYVPLPGRYFAEDNPKGFARTAVWLANMRMTNKRAEKARQRFQFVSKSITAVLHSTGKHLESGGIHSYTANRSQLADKYPHLATAFDWIVLDPQTQEE